ncbi:MAG: hypothetical protein NWR73_03300 [Flavobacteriales bacterium]|nr:hypothetical protein [Flavobacteriales bacterium]
MRFFLRIFVVTLVYLSIGVQAARHYSHDHNSDLISAFCELDSSSEEDFSDSNDFLSKWTGNSSFIRLRFFQVFDQTLQSRQLAHIPSCHGWYISRYLDFQRFNL